MSQLLSEDGPWASDTLTYTYNNRLRQSLSLQQPSGAWTNGYAYDVAKRLTNITSQAGAFGYAYDVTRQSLVSKLALPNTAFITNSYDAMTRLLSTQLKNNSGMMLNSHSYGYNLASQRTTLTNTTGDYRNYTYDNLGQLKTAVGKESGGTINRLNEQLGYSYDAAGNLNYRTNNALVQTFNNNSLNELITVTRTGTLTVAGNTTTTATNVTVNALTAIRYADLTYARTNFPLVSATTNFTAIATSSTGLWDTNTVTVDLRSTNTFVYDLNGNLGSDGKRGFDYDDENQLVRITVTNGWKTELIYDGQYRRRIRKEFAWQGGAWTQTNEVRYFYDGSQVIQERDGGNVPKVSYTRTSLSLLARTDNFAGTHAYYHSDGNLNVTALVNGNQLLVAKYLYDSFGRNLSQSGPLAEANVYQFSSQEFHEPSGLTLYLRRAYDSNLQRWLNRDPIAETGGINLYGFVGNDPVNEIDLDGRYFGFVAEYLANKINTIAESSGSGTLGYAASLFEDAAGLAKGVDPFYTSYQAAKTIKNEGVSELLAQQYHALEEGVGTADFVRARDYGDEYSGWEQLGYGTVGVAKSFLCVVGAKASLPAAKGAEDVLVLGRGPLDRLQRLATQEGGRVSTIDSTVAKEIFKNNYRDIRSADRIIQYMDNIPTTLQESLQIGGQYSRAEVFMINQRKDLLQKTIRKFENPP